MFVIRDRCVCVVHVWDMRVCVCNFLLSMFPCLCVLDRDVMVEMGVADVSVWELGEDFGTTSECTIRLGDCG